MIFKTSDKEFFKDNPEALAIPQFKALGDAGMKFINLVYGHKSPIRTMMPTDKKHKAITLCGLKRTPKGRPSKLETDLLEVRGKLVKGALSEYHELQWDEDIDMLNAYDSLLTETKDLMRNKDKTDRQYDQCMKAAKGLPELLVIRKRIIDTLEIRVEEVSVTDPVDENMDSSDSLVEDYLETKNEDKV